METKYKNLVDAKTHVYRTRTKNDSPWVSVDLFSTSVASLSHIVGLRKIK